MVADTKIGLLGCGVVGSEVAQQLLHNKAQLSTRAGTPLSLRAIAVRNLTTQRPRSIPDSLLTTDAEHVTATSDIVIEVMGGIEPARSLIHQAFQHGASVITANKALLAEHGHELSNAARAAGVTLHYEAAVAAAIPLIQPIQQSLSGDRITKIMGIVNGTTNYVLDQMHVTGAHIADAVQQAQELGYAEADPTADVEGHDAAAKGSILASLAFDTHVPTSAVRRTGITDLTPADIAMAQRAGQVIKLLAICQVHPQAHNAVSVRVHPTLLPEQHPLATVRGAMNAVFIETQNAGPLMFYGAGAGGRPTASAILGDTVTSARLRQHNAPLFAELVHPETATNADPSTIDAKYCIRCTVEDTAGVLEGTAGVFAAHDVSLNSVYQTSTATTTCNSDKKNTAELTLVTHTASEERLNKTVQALKTLPTIKAVDSVIRVEGTTA